MLSLGLFNVTIKDPFLFLFLCKHKNHRCRNFEKTGIEGVCSAEKPVKLVGLSWKPHFPGASFKKTLRKKKMLIMYIVHDFFSEMQQRQRQSYILL